MLRRALLFLSEREGLRDLLLRTPLFRSVAGRFVAGDTLEDALEATGRLNGEGFRVTLDHLGESVRDRATAEAATRAYRESLRAIEERGVGSTISLKLTQLGLDLDGDFCERNLRSIVDEAERRDSFVRIDMESSRYTDSTLEIFHRIWPERRGRVGVVIQAYLHRSEADIRRLVEVGAPVRLCKGAYDEPPELAYRERADVDANFVRLMRILLEGGVPTAIATHDDRMIDATLEELARPERDDRQVEFQMLYGVRRELQRAILDEGHPVRIYVPYGAEWYPYLMRRMAERPANLGLVLRALVSG